MATREEIDSVIADLVRAGEMEAASKAAALQPNPDMQGPLDDICPGDGTCMKLVVQLIPVIVPLIVPMITNCPKNTPEDRIRIKRILTGAIDDILRGGVEDETDTVGPSVNT